MTDYGEKVFKKGKHAGSTYEQVYDKEGVGYFQGMIQPEAGDPPHLATWKKNMVSWLETKSPDVQLDTIETTNDEVNVGMAGFTKQLLELMNKINELNVRITNLENGAKWAGEE